MKLLLHNVLTSNILKGVKTGFPLKLNATSVVVQEKKFSREFIKTMLDRIDWPVFVEAATNLGHGKGLNASDPPRVTEPSTEQDDELFRRIHHALLEVDVVEGELVCPETGRVFPIKDGIPNMLLNKDEYA